MEISFLLTKNHIIHHSRDICSMKSTQDVRSARVFYDGGCSLVLHLGEGRIVRYSTAVEHPASRGWLSPKDLTAREPLPETAFNPTPFSQAVDSISTRWEVDQLPRIAETISPSNTINAGLREL